MCVLVVRDRNDNTISEVATFGRPSTEEIDTFFSGTLLFGGDTNATLNGREYVYCIAIRSLNTAILDEIRAALIQSTEFQRIAAFPRFIKNVLVAKEHLIDAGRVDSAGNLIGYAHNSRVALGMVRKEKQQFVQTGQPSAPIPLRKKPARSTAMIEE